MRISDWSSDVCSSDLKVADEHWTALPMPPQDDPERRVLFPPSTAATLNLAATAAQCARIWRGIDPAFSARCLDAAKRAFTAAEEIGRASCSERGCQYV